MKDYKKMVFVSIMVALASEISIGIMNNDFSIVLRKEKVIKKT